MYEKIKFSVTGISPLILHNGQLADPQGEPAKALKKVSAIRKKTDAHYEEMARIEWFGGLYLNEKQQVILPGENIERAFIDGAKKSRMGREFTSAIMSNGLWVVKHKGPSDLEALYADKRFVDRRGVRVNNAKVFRTRPIFHEWSIDFTIEFLSSVLNASQVKEVANVVGQIIGFGDYRPRFGRFVVN